MKLNANRTIFCAIVCIALFVRFWNLGSLPSGLTWDEAAIGYNAYGLLTNHRDEWLNRIPVVFRSFGDYKSPLLIYLTTIPVAIFGLTPFAVRLPIAVAGTGLVIVSFLLTKEITRLSALRFKLSPHFVMLFVALSPWAITYSRLAFESMLAAFLLSFGVYCWLRGRKMGLWLVFGDMSFALSLYAYHSAKIVVPILVLLLCSVYYKDFIRHKKHLIVGVLLAFLLLVPLAFATIFGKANDRALSTTILSKPHVVLTFISNYVAHLSSSFLVYGKDISYRQSTKETGVLYPIELILFLVGVIAIIRDKNLRPLWWIPTLFFVGIIPAALGIDVPHSNRALLALPWVQITAGIGIFNIQHSISNKKIRFGIWILVFGFLIYSSVRYLQIYQKVYNSSTALREFGYGYQEAISYARSQEGSVRKVYFTNTYGQAYIYLLFFKRLTPLEFHQGAFANYTLIERPFDGAVGQTNVLVVGTPDEIPGNANIVKEIKYPDGKVAFRISLQ